MLKKITDKLNSLSLNRSNYFFLDLHKVLAIQFLFLLVIFHISLIFLAPNIAADEIETPSIENKNVLKNIKTKNAYLDIFTNDYGMRFVAISPGKYLMGSPSNELGRTYIFENQHAISIENHFYLQTTEVTQRHWRKVMGNNPSFFKACGEDCPVENVSWFDVNNFIRKLNRISTESRYRLPTEAEWEYACRSGSTSAFSTGDLRTIGCDENSSLDNIAWYGCNSDNATHPVRRKAPNNMGLYDMHGNVNEWCIDEFVVNHSDHFNQNTNQIDPSKDKVVRGGSWLDGPASCRSASRNNINPSIKDRTIGFRLVRESIYHKIKAPPSLQTEKEESENIKLNIDNDLPNDKLTPQIDYREPTNFTVQVESTKSLDYAERQVASFKAKGYNAFHVKVTIPDMGIWYRICFGNFNSKSEAVMFRNKLSRESIDGIIIEI